MYSTLYSTVQYCTWTCTARGTPASKQACKNFLQECLPCPHTAQQKTSSTTGWRARTRARVSMASAAAVAARLARQRFNQREGTYSGTYIQQQYNRSLASGQQSVRVIQQPPSEPQSILPDKLQPGMEIRLVPLVYYDGSSNNSEKEECGICLSAFVEGDPMRIPQCCHKFHSKCLRQWFNAGGPCCPICRFTVEIPVENRSASGAAMAARMLGLQEQTQPQLPPTRRLRILAKLRSVLQQAANLARGAPSGSGSGSSSRPRRERRIDPFLDEWWGSPNEPPLLERYEMQRRNASG